MGRTHVRPGLQCILYLGCFVLVQCLQDTLIIEEVDSVSIEYECGQHQNDTTMVIRSSESNWNASNIKVLCQNGYISISPQVYTIHMYYPHGFYYNVVSSPCIFRGPFDVPGNELLESYQALISYNVENHEHSAYSVECFLRKTYLRPNVVKRRIVTPSPGNTVVTGETAAATTPESPTAGPTQPADSTASFTTPEVTSTLPPFNVTDSISSSTLSHPATTPTSTRPPILSPGDIPACALDFHPNYIVEIVPHCDTVINNSPWIEVITDLEITAMATCQGGFTYDFVTTDSVNLRLSNSYDYSSADSTCVFSRRNDSAVYNVLVQLLMGQNDKRIQACRKQYQVTCTFDLHASQGTSALSASSTLMAATEIQTNQGDDSVSSIDVQVVDVLGNLITGSLPLRRKVQLKAVASGTETELGIKPVSCDAVGVQFGRRYAILRAGCGDGLVFSQSAGFTTIGLSTFSPYFKTFQLHGDSQLRFECNFTLCSGLCDGSSCTNQAKRKRSADRLMSAIQTGNDIIGDSSSHQDTKHFVIAIFSIASLIVIVTHCIVLYKRFNCKK